MAVALGINSGFVATAPTADPGGTGLNVNGSAVATQDTAPAGATSIVKVWWWSDNNASVDNFEVGLLSDDGGSPGVMLALLSVSRTNSTTGTGWKSATVSWPITAGTKYWLGLQKDGTGATDYGSVTGGRMCVFGAAQATMLSPITGTYYANFSLSICAEYSSAPLGPAIPVLMNQYRQRRR